MTIISFSTRADLVGNAAVLVTLVFNPSGELQALGQ
jgi:hypothetical protein